MEIINPDLFLFLSKLKRNNNREWFQSNKAEFKKLESEVKSFVKKIEENLQNHDKIEKSKIWSCNEYTKVLCKLDRKREDGRFIPTHHDGTYIDVYRVFLSASSEGPATQAYNPG